MTVAKDNHKDNIIIGAGEFYLVELDDNDSPLGERYLGDSLGGSLTVTTETSTVFSGDGPVAETLAQITNQITRTLSLTLHDMSPANLALFIMGEEDDKADVATAVADEEITIAKQGLWHQLGVSTARPEGIGAVTGVTVVAEDSGGSGIGSLAANTDYIVDEANGRVKVVEGGKIVATSKLKVDYTPVAGTVRRAVTGDARQVRAGIRYIETAAFGKGNNIYAPLCNITPSGEAAFKAPGRSTEQQFQLAAEILEPGAGPGLVINGQAA